MEEKQKKHWIIGLGVYAAIFLLILFITNLGPFNGWLGGLLRLLRPVIIGLVIAYLFNPFFRIFERKLFFKIKPHSLRRGLSLLFTYLVLLLIVGVLLMLIIPQLVDSIVNFVSESDSHIDNTIKEINNLIAMLNEQFPAKEGEAPAISYLDPEKLKESLSSFLKNINLDSATILSYIDSNTVSSVFGLASNVLAIITDTIFGLFISLYLLHTKEKRYAQIIRLRKAIFSDAINQRITNVCAIADKSFGGFIRGKILDSTIVGVLVYVIISMLNVPYAILIAVIVGITDIVPIIGPFIGVIPSAVIILLTDPSKVIPFLLCILIVQQIDGNIIAPKILGENTGVSSLCVMIAITTMGSLWGLVGMVIGVPLFATVLELTGAFLDKRLEKKGLPSNTEYYYTNEGADVPQEDTGNLIRRMQKKKLLRLQSESAGGEGTLTAFERFQLDTYALARKYRIKKPDAIPEGFVEEEQELTAAVQEQIEAEVEAEIEAAADANLPNEALTPNDQKSDTAPNGVTTDQGNITEETMNQ